MIINIVRKTKSISFTVTVPAGSHLSIKYRVHKSLQKIYKHSLSYQPPQKFYHFNFLQPLNGFCKHDEFNHCKQLFLYFLLLQLQLAVNRLYAQKQWNWSTCIASIQGQSYSWPSWGFEIMELFQALLSMERCHLQSTAPKGDCITSSIFTLAGVSVASHW